MKAITTIFESILSGNDNIVWSPAGRRVLDRPAPPGVGLGRLTHPEHATRA